MNVKPKNANTMLDKIQSFMLKQTQYLSAESICTSLGYDLLSNLGSVKSRLRDLNIMDNGRLQKLTQWKNGKLEYKIIVRTPGQQYLFQEFAQHVEDYNTESNNQNIGRQ